MPTDKTTVEFHYIKSNEFRVVHVDGAMGGITPAGLIFVSLYSERPAIPQVMVHEVTEEGQIGPERLEERVGKKGVVREIEVGATMSLETAINFVKWLQDRIDLVNKVKSDAEQDKEKNALHRTH
jgi:hypothetical protein